MPETPRTLRGCTCQSCESIRNGHRGTTYIEYPSQDDLCDGRDGIMFAALRVPSRVNSTPPPETQEVSCWECGRRTCEPTDACVSDYNNNVTRSFCRSCAGTYTGECTECGGRFYRSLLARGVGLDGGDLCTPCAREAGFIACQACGSWTDDYVHLSDLGNVCMGCGENAHYCERCDRMYYYNNYDCECRDRNDRGRLYAWNYRPELNFRGEGPAYLGFELEMNCDDPRDILPVLDGYRDLAYCKEDGSVEGMEMVTHPMTYSWAMSNFPWAKLEEMYQAGARRGSNGLHVHVSRDGFDGDAHALRWIRFIYTNQSPVCRLARRRSDRWAGFGDAYDLERKVAHGESTERYTAVNCQNDATFEVRLFASSLRPRPVQAALGFVDASRVYTSEALDPTWDEFVSWVEDRPEYEPLKREIARLCTR